MPSVLQVLPYANLNGTERHVQLLAQHAMAQGWSVTVALPPGPMRELLREAGIPLVELPPIRIGTFGKVRKQLLEAMRGHDLCHVHAAMELALALGWGRRFPVVFTAHCYHTALDYAKAGLFLNPSCTATISVSSAERTRLLAGGLDAARHRTILNGIVLAPFHAAPASGLRAERGIPDDAFVVGTLGRLSKLKRVDVLIRAIALTETPIHLAVAGDGEERQALERLASRLGLSERVHWLGRRQDVPELLAGFDVFATASEREGLSLAALEAMASGLPLTVSAIPEFEELSDPRWAIALPTGVPEGWAAAWDGLYLDPTRRARMGQEARIASHAFSAERVGEETLSLYRELLTTGTNGRSAGSPPEAPAS